MLGEFRVALGERMVPPTAWDHRRAADLVKLLALSTGHRRARDEVLEILCPNLDPDAAAGALHKAASIARRVLGDTNAIALRGGDVMLAPHGIVDTDVTRFEDAARQALAANDAQACTRAATLYTGELLPSDRYADWVSPHRDRLAARYLELLRRAGAWEKVVQHEPLDEGAFPTHGDRALTIRPNKYSCPHGWCTAGTAAKMRAQTKTEHQLDAIARGTERTPPLDVRLEERRASTGAGHHSRGALLARATKWMVQVDRERVLVATCVYSAFRLSRACAW